MDLSALGTENVYDSFDIGRSGVTQRGWGQTHTPDGEAWLRMFGNTNVGNRELSNMQAAGQMGSARTFIVQRWYARHNLPESNTRVMDVFRTWASSVICQFIIGNMWRWTAPLVELLDRRPRTADGVVRTAADPFPCLVPPRQSFYVQVDQYGNSVDRFEGVIVDDMRPTRVWVHLEGFVFDTDYTRSGFDLKKILSLILVGDRARRTVEEQIVTWLGVQIETADPDAQGQLHAVRDAILEGRHLS